MSCVVGQPQAGRLSARPGDLLRGLQERAHLGVAILRAADSFAVDAQRDVVEEHPVVHFADVDQPLDPVGERLEGTGRVVAVDSEVEGEVVPGPGRHADKRKPAGGSHGRHLGQRAVAARHPQRTRAAGRSSTGQGGQALARIQDDHLDAELACPLGDPRTRRSAAARPGVHEQDGRAGRAGGLPALG